MATIISHTAIPFSLRIILGKKNVSNMLLFYACVASMLPDIDVVSFVLGIPYESQFGHRGCTHSIFFALVIGLLGTLFNKYLNCKKNMAFIVLGGSVLSHPLLDALTNGGHGVALFWPFSKERIFFPWQPIEVSPIGLRSFISERGMEVIQSEILTIWAPCFLAVVLILILKKSAKK